MPADDLRQDHQDKTRLSSGGDQADGIEFQVGQIVGNTYEILAFIGAGGMGNVYRVRHNIMDKEYALKTLSLSKFNQVSWTRFKNEARAIARLNHPNIVGIYNLGLHENTLPYYIMDLFSGDTLVSVLQERGFIEIEETLALFQEVCAGVGSAHKNDIVHRDIKPGNILVLEAPDSLGARIKIVDFGIAKVPSKSDLEQQQLTHAGEVFGSPYYMSPEQCEGVQIDKRSDIYSIGCTLFETLTGTVPFQGQSAIETMLLHGTMTPPTMQQAVLEKFKENRAFPARLEKIVATALAKSPDDRYQSIDHMSRDLAMVQSELKKSKRYEQSQDDEVEPRKNNFLIIACIAGLIVSGIAAVAIFITLQQKHKNVREVGSNVMVSAVGHDAPIKKDVETKQTGPLPPFSRIVIKADGKKFVHFSFPPGEDAGMIWGESDNSMVCKGNDFELPCGQLTFALGNLIITNPQYLNRFAPDTFNELRIDKNYSTVQWDDRFFQYIPHLSGLKAVTLNECDAVDKNLDFIDKLPKLEKLTIKDTKLTAPALARCKAIHRLKKMEVENFASLTPILKELENSTTIKELNIGYSRASLLDFQLIGTLSNLRQLDCDRTETNDSDIEALTRLKHLHKLSAQYNRLTFHCIPALQKIFVNSDSELNVRSFTIAPADFVQMQKALPKVKFILHTKKGDDSIF